MSYDQIPGFSGFLWMYDDAVEHFASDATFVEVGVALGHSITYLVRKRIDAGKAKGPTFAVDPWAGYARNGEQQTALGIEPRGDFYLFARTMLEHAALELDMISPIRATSVRASRLFDIKSVDMVMIDGAHDFENVSLDIYAWHSKVKDGGWIGGDDYDPKYPGVEKAVRDFFPADKIEVVGTTWRVRL